MIEENFPQIKKDQLTHKDTRNTNITSRKGQKNFNDLL